jgi:hypothetical protein
MPETTKPEHHGELEDDDEDSESIRVIDVVRAISRRTRKSPIWGPLELAMQIHRAFNKHLLLAQKEMFELEIKYVDRLIAADEEAEHRDRQTSPGAGPRRKKVIVDG